jgi:DNA polymerase-1
MNSIRSDAKHILIIDGYGFVFRAYHALPTLTRADGVPIGAVFGFSSMLMKLLNDFDVSHLVVVFDAGQKNFRHELYEEYKANRSTPPDDLKQQFPVMREIVEAFNVVSIEKTGFEADDIIATLSTSAKNQGFKVTIVSSDKDLMQLVEDDTVRMFDPLKSKIINEAVVFEKFGVYPKSLLDLLAMVGDASDNIPGVPTIGVKTAAELLITYGSLDEILSSIGQIKQPKRRETLENHRAQALLSRQLVTLDHNVPLTCGLDHFEARLPIEEILIEFLSKQGFKSLITKARAQFKFTASSEAAQEDVPIVECQYFLITKASVLQKWCANVHQTGKIALYLQMNYPAKPFNFAGQSIIGVALAISERVACYVPLGDITLEEIVECLAPIFVDPAIIKIGHDIKDLLSCLHYFGHKLLTWQGDDVMVMSYLLDGNQHKHDLATLTAICLTQDYSKLVEGLAKDSKDLIQLPMEVQNHTENYSYFASFANKIYLLHQAFKDKIISNKLLTIYQKIDAPLLQILFEIEQVGVKIDLTILEDLSTEFRTRIAILSEKIFEIAGYEFTLSSPTKLGEVLFGHLGLEAGRKTAKLGRYSTDAETLDKLSLQGHVIADYLLEWRQLTKLQNTYTDALPREVNVQTRRVHTHLDMTLTSTGRLSSSRPNLQNIPIRDRDGNKIRSAFIAENGYKLISADYSQMELRILAHMADVPALKTAFVQQQDAHIITAADIFGVSIEQVTAEMRRKAKTINYGVIYGISSFGLAKQLDITPTEAAEYIKSYFKQYPGLQEYMEKTKIFAREHGYVLTLSGRKIYTPEINSGNFQVRSFSERAAINAPLQGSAADIIKKAMVGLDFMLKKSSYQARMILQVHDELLIEVLAGDAETVATLLKTTMETIIALTVPMVVDVKIGNNWAEIH